MNPQRANEICEKMLSGWCIDIQGISRSEALEWYKNHFLKYQLKDLAQKYAKETKKGVDNVMEAIKKRDDHLSIGP